MGSAHCCCFAESETWREDVTFQTETHEFNEATPSYTTADKCAKQTLETDSPETLNMMTLMFIRHFKILLSFCFFHSSVEEDVCVYIILS